MFTIALSMARMTPTVRAQIFPEKTAMPAKMRMAPPMMWVQPQAV